MEIKYNKWTREYSLYCADQLIATIPYMDARDYIEWCENELDTSDDVAAHRFAVLLFSGMVVEGDSPMMAAIMKHYMKTG